jgi:hypothetical protein
MPEQPASIGENQLREVRKQDRLCLAWSDIFNRSKTHGLDD